MTPTMKRGESGGQTGHVLKSAVNSRFESRRGAAHAWTYIWNGHQVSYVGGLDKKLRCLGQMPRDCSDKRLGLFFAKII